MEFAIGWIGLAVLVGFLADSRGRSGGGFFLLSLLLSPLLGFIIVLVTADLKKKAAQEKQEAYDREREHERRLEEIRALKTEPSSKEEAKASRSVADELVKLAALRDSGVLSEEEFQAQKRAILSTP